MARILLIGSETVLRSKILLRGTFFAFMFLTMIKKRMIVLSCRLLQCLLPVNTLTAEGCSETGSGMHLINDVFCSE